MVSVEDRWPTENSTILQLYSINSPNGVKVAAMLEEVQIPYEPHLINLWNGEQHSEAFRSISPNAKIPVIIDIDGPDGRPITMMESGAILHYLAEKTSRLLPTDPVVRNECLQRLFFQTAHIGPMFGQFEHFHRRGDVNEKDPYAIDRYRNEATRLLEILEDSLKNRPCLMGDDYAIDDIAVFPWISSMRRIEKDGLPLADFPLVLKWHTA